MERSLISQIRFLKDILNMPTNAKKVTVIIGHVQFVVLTAIAMLFYPGGTIWDKTTTSYIFHLNFFSDLGIKTSLSGIASPVSPIFFAIATTLIGLSQLIFYYYMYHSLKNNDFLRKSTFLFGYISAIAIMFVGQLPHDTHEDQHMLAVIVWLLGFIVVVVIYSYLFTLNNNRSFWIVAFNMPLLAVIVIHIVQQRYGLIEVMPLTQKIIVYYMIAWFIVMAQCRLR